jgi:POT family proton-dependent oligopeptide transporter
LSRATAKRYPLSNLLIAICVATIWVLLIWMLVREFEADKSEIDEITVANVDN